MSVSDDILHAEVTPYTLEKETELRLEVADVGTAYVKLMSGNAEVFGVELAEGVPYAFSAGKSIAVYTWYGASVHTWGSIASAYKVGDTAMPTYAALHQRLEARRDEARHVGGYGPRVLLVGPIDSGKSTLCRILCAYACRVGRSPTFVDLDIGQGEISVPGAIAATPLDRLSLSPEEGYVHTVPLVHFIGHVGGPELGDVYLNNMQRLAETVNKKLDADEQARVSGMVVNTMGWVDGKGYDMILQAIQAFKIDVVLVMGHDRVVARLSEDCKSIRFPAFIADSGVAAHSASSASAERTKVISILRLVRPGGVANREQDKRKAARKARIREYFYGPDRGPGVPSTLAPVSLVVKFSDIVLVRVGGTASDDGILPIGKSTTLDPLRVTPVVPTANCQNNLVGVSFAQSEKQVPHVNVAGFAHITKVDRATETITLLVPTMGPLPGRYLILGTITWME